MPGRTPGTTTRTAVVIKKTAAALVLSLAVAGCSLDFIPWPKDGEPMPWLAAEPATPADPNDPANDVGMATARFGFILMVIGSLAGVMALQQWMQTNKDIQVDPTIPGDTKFAAFMRQREPAIAVPIAAFGLGVGLPVYIVSSIMAEQQVEEEKRKRLTPGP